MSSILDLFEKTVEQYPNKVAFADETMAMTYEECCLFARKAGIAIRDIVKDLKMCPIVLDLPKSIYVPALFLGVMYSGNFYTCIDKDMGDERKKNISTRLQAKLIITDSYKDCYSCKQIVLDDLLEIMRTINDDNRCIKPRLIECDPAYVLFTSGSTGIPKGSVISHKAVISYATWIVKTFGITSDTVFGNQTPFYFSMSVLDIYATLVSGGTLEIIPKKFFSFPVKLLQYIDERNINTLYWVPSAYGIVSNWKALDYVLPKNLHTMLFAGEVMPTKYLIEWQKHIPNAMYVNLFGPTEITDIALYYIVDKNYSVEEPIPIGIVSEDMDAIVINEEGNVAQDGEVGELYFRGSFVGYGYYNDPEKTREAFVQNPLNHNYPEIVYKTGDLVKKENGLYWYLGRKDFQIKHMGYRIELGEIENAIIAHEKIQVVACVYDEHTDRIIAYYVGSIKDGELEKYLQDYLPSYMRPTQYVKLHSMQYNSNGKIDRVALKKMGELT